MNVQFRHLLRSEWTKLRSVPRWLMTLGLGAALMVLMAVLTAAASGSDAVNEDGAGPAATGEPASDLPGSGPPEEAVPDSPGPDRLRQGETVDQLHLVHQPLAGDGSIVAQVVAQADSQEWAKAGIMVKEGPSWGSPYAAMMVTPDHGVRMQWDYTDDRAGSDSVAPVWLKLTRTGDTIAGYESPDGDDWTEVGTVELDDLPETVEAGMFVTSPEAVNIERMFGGESIDIQPTQGEASFDNVTLEPATNGSQASPGAWRDYNTSIVPDGGEHTENDGVFRLYGSGDVGEHNPELTGDDLVESSLLGALIGALAIVALGVLFITSEHKRGMIRTTLAASPRRSRVLLAKAAVLGSVTFLAGLLASVVSFLVAYPELHSKLGPAGAQTALADGKLALTDPVVLRAVVGTGVLLAAIAVLSLAVGAITRRSAAAISTVTLLVVLPFILQTGLPLSVARWINRLTPAAGFAVQETVERYDSAIVPLGGLAVVCAYALVTLGLACWLLERRDA